VLVAQARRARGFLRLEVYRSRRHGASQQRVTPFTCGCPMSRRAARDVRGQHRDNDGASDAQ